MDLNYNRVKTIRVILNGIHESYLTQKVETNFISTKLYLRILRKILSSFFLYKVFIKKLLVQVRTSTFLQIKVGHCTIVHYYKKCNNLDILVGRKNVQMQYCKMIAINVNHASSFHKTLCSYFNTVISMLGQVKLHI